MKKLLCAMLIALGVVLLPLTAEAQTQIRHHLGVNYTISPTEYTYNGGGTLITWRRVTTYGRIRMNDMPSGFGGTIRWSMQGTTLIPTETGDVVIVTFPPGYDFLGIRSPWGQSLTLLIVDDGPWYEDGTNLHRRSFYTVPINAALLPAPRETVVFRPPLPPEYLARVNPENLTDCGNHVHVLGAGLNLRGIGNREFFELHRERNRTQFGMINRYTTENFYWYSNEELAHWLPIIAAYNEPIIHEVFDMFGFSLPRMSVWFYSHADYFTRHGDFWPEVYYGSWGRGAYAQFLNLAFNYSLDWGVHEMTDAMIANLVPVFPVVHETVHIFQQQLICLYYLQHTRRMSWLLEGLATYPTPCWRPSGGGMGYLRERVRERVRANHIPTLDWLENEARNFHMDERTDFETNYDAAIPVSFHSIGYWGASIVEFIVNTWSMEHVMELHRTPTDYLRVFGITRAQFERQWHQWLRNWATVQIDGRHVDFFGGSSASSVGNQVTAPVCVVFEEMGYAVSWNERMQRLTLTNNNHTVIFTIGSNYFTVNGVRHRMPATAQRIHGRTIIPISAVLAHVGLGANWNADTRTLNITHPWDVAIRRVLGTDFTVSDVVHDWGTARLRLLDVHGDINLVNFPAESWGWDAGQSTGGVFVACMNDGIIRLFVDIGEHPNPDFGRWLRVAYLYGHNFDEIRPIEPAPRNLWILVDSENLPIENRTRAEVSFAIHVGNMVPGTFEVRRGPSNSSAGIHIDGLPEEIGVSGTVYVNAHGNGSGIITLTMLRPIGRTAAENQAALVRIARQVFAP